MSKKLSQAALKKACNRHNWALQWCWNYEKMQAAGYRSTLMNSKFTPPSLTKLKALVGNYLPVDICNISCP